MEQILKVTSWNVHRCFGTDRRYWPERVADVLKQINADVIALQEIDSSLRVEGESNQLDYIATALGMTAVMGPTLKRDYGAYGNALLTRQPIRSFEERDLSFRKFEPRGALTVELETSVGFIRFVNVHLGLKYWERSFQINRVLAELIGSHPAGSPDAVILLGDFNEWCPFTPNTRRLERAFRYASPRLKTFPAHWPRLALDRIFFSGRLETLSCSVETQEFARVASDHLPLSATFYRSPDSKGPVD